MRILSWDIRGTGQKELRDQIKELSIIYKPKIIVMKERKVIPLERRELLESLNSVTLLRFLPLIFLQVFG